MIDDDLPIIDLVLADINAVVPNFSSLVSSYRLLVGAAEEVRRTPGVPTEIFQRAVLRYDRAGTLIDVLLELLCCKIVFASKFLGTVCAPIDLPRYFVNDSEADYTPQHTAEQILLIELLRLILTSVCEERPCFGPPPPDIGCPPLPPPCIASPPGKAAPVKNGQPAGSIDSDAEDLLSEIAPELLTNLTNIASSSTQPTTPTSSIGSNNTGQQSSGSRYSQPPLRRKHYEKGASVSKRIT